LTDSLPCIPDINESLILAGLKRLQPGLPHEGIEAHLTRAAVLVPLLCNKSEWSLLFTLRTDAVLDHKGQVSFPGGAFENGDASILETALRETDEEIGLDSGKVRVLGIMPELTTVTRYRITPVVGMIPWPVELSLSEGEVSRVFTIPIKWLAEPKNHESRTVTINGRIRENVIFFSPFDEEILWGITASITLDFLKILLE